jgi:hypothetical protein
MVLADDTSPVFTARAMNAIGSSYADIDKLTSVFRGTGAMKGQHHARLFEQAGYTRFRRAAQTPLNLILQARP